jgi:hypothetical protein
MPNKQISNYERLCDEWAGRMKTVDMQAVMHRLPEVEFDGSAYTLHHFGRKLAMDSENFTITAPEDDRALSIDEIMNFYTLLWYCRDGARLTGQWRPFGEIRDASPFAPAFKRGILEPFAQTFSGNITRLERASQEMGAVKLAVSDCGFQLKAFECIPVQCLIWDGDEEFSARANMLFDISITDFIHVESVVSIAQRCLASLAERAGLPIKGSTFSMG